MAKKWRDLYNNLPAERRSRIEAQVAKDLAELPLAEIRRARQLTQEGVANSLGVNQAWVSKLEHQTDMYLSTLQSFVEAMGGELDIIVRFDDGAVRIRQLGEMDREPQEWTQAGGESNETPFGAVTHQMNVSLWNPPSADVRIWQARDSTATTRPQTPSRNTPGSPKNAMAA